MTTMRPTLERIPSFSDPDDFRLSRERFAIDIELLNERCDELTGQWPDEWCTIFGGRIFHAQRHDDLMRILISHGIEPRRAAVTFLLTPRGRLRFG